MVKILLALLILLTLLGVYLWQKPKLGTTYYVNPGGGKVNSIQKAIDLAEPGDFIYLSAGIYYEDIQTKKDGKPNLPITITGPRDAVVVGRGKGRVFEINHSYINLKGFTIDGQFGAGTKASDFRDKLLYISGKQPKKGVTGLKVTEMAIQNAGGECVRLRYFAQNNEIGGNTIRNCGIYDFRFSKKGKNGEGVYIGTAPEQLKDEKNPTDDKDESSNNWIHNNLINTQGNECVDIKESSEENLVESNSCTGQKDPDSGGMDSRGNSNTFRNNNIFGNAGAGVRLGGDRKNDGINNNVYSNSIKGNSKGGIKFEKIPQGKICGNTMSANKGGDLVGSYNKQSSPTEQCKI